MDGILCADNTKSPTNTHAANLNYRIDMLTAVRKLYDTSVWGFFKKNP